MSKEKQIEGIIEAMGESCASCFGYGEAEAIYNAGYRKHSQWISFDERLPEKDGRYLVAMKDGDKYHISTRRFKRTDPPIWWKGHVYGYWAKRTCGVRFWMPLPEPPVMKGGAE